MSGWPYAAEPWPSGEEAETLITGPTATAVLGPPWPGPWPQPRDPCWQQADVAGPDTQAGWEEGQLW